MSPTSIRSDLPDGRRGNAEFGCYLAIAATACDSTDDSGDIFVGELCGVASGAEPVAPLGEFVSHVVVVRSEKQVVRPNAPWVVAPVAHMHAVGYFSAESLPGFPVRRQDRSVDGNLPVPCRRNRANPIPTPIASFGKTFNSLFDGRARGRFHGKQFITKREAW